MKPRIGLSMNYRTLKDQGEQVYLDSGYFDAVARAGGIPMPIVPLEDVVMLEAILRIVDGVVLTGGLDLDAGLYGERLHPATTLLHPRRQRFELLLYQQATKHKLPLLGICLGAQVVNVAHGGALHQHLPEDEHYMDHGTGRSGTTRHLVKLAAVSRLREWLKVDELTVPSAHHQGIVRLGEGLQAAAVTADGIVEAVERPDYPFLLAVQWHPERHLDEPYNRVILERFVQAARERRKSRAEAAPRPAAGGGKTGLRVRIP